MLTAGSQPRTPALALWHCRRFCSSRRVARRAVPYRRFTLLRAGFAGYLPFNALPPTRRLPAVCFCAATTMLLARYCARLTLCLQQRCPAPAGFLPRTSAFLPTAAFHAPAFVPARFPPAPACHACRALRYPPARLLPLLFLFDYLPLLLSISIWITGLPCSTAACQHRLTLPRSLPPSATTLPLQQRRRATHHGSRSPVYSTLLCGPAVVAFCCFATCHAARPYIGYLLPPPPALLHAV